jgi:colanic acid/amylovoran biosynthesis glycosyltransferase
MRVVHLVRTFLPRTQTFIYSQLTHLPPQKAAVLTRNAQHQDRFPGIEIRAFDLEPGTWPKRWAGINYRVLRRMTDYEQQYYLREIRGLEPDLFHTHFAVDAAYFLDVCRQFNLPLIVSCYGYDVSSFPNRYLGWGRRYLQPVWQCASLVLAMSNDMRADLLRLGCPDEKIRIHYYGINLEQFKYVERELAPPNVRLLFVGSLSDRKGVEDVLRAFAQVAKQRAQMELRIVGDGLLRSKLEQLVRDWGLENRVSFAGFVLHEDLPDELYRAHIFCHPSRTLKNGDKEGIPGTIVEAMATGLPVVTTRHAGIPEMVRDGEDGFVVAERDVNAIALALLTLIDKPALRVKMGCNAAMQVEQKADAVRLTEELESIYSDVMASVKETCFETQ